MSPSRGVGGFRGRCGLSFKTTGLVACILALAVGYLPLLAACGGGSSLMGAGQAPETKTEKASAKALFVVSYKPDLGSVPIGQMQTWTLHVRSAAGDAVGDAQITVDGGMPAMKHGLPTAPQVTAYLGSGDYRVEGLEFQMPGWWTVTFRINAGGGQDAVTFNLQLG